MNEIKCLTDFYYYPVIYGRCFLSCVNNKTKFLFLARVYRKKLRPRSPFCFTLLIYFIGMPRLQDFRIFVFIYSILLSDSANIEHKARRTSLLRHSRYLRVFNPPFRIDTFASRTYLRISLYLLCPPLFRTDTRRSIH